MKNTKDDEFFNSEQGDAKQGHNQELNRTDLPQHGTISYQTTRHAEICIDYARKKNTHSEMNLENSKSRIKMKTTYFSTPILILPSA